MIDNKNKMDQANERALAIFKFGNRPNMEAFVDGLLYMNTLEYFAKIETDLLRHDSKEGDAFWVQGKLCMKIDIDSEFQEISGIKGPLRFSDPNDLRANVFCMYALRGSQAHRLIDKKNLDFGDTAVFLKDGDEFLKRVEIAALSSGQRLEYRLVEYLDEGSYHGPMGIFKKSSAFSYQSEFRIALLPGTGEPFRLVIGDLSDIAAIGSLDQLNSALRIDGEAGQERLLASLVT